MTKFNFNPDVDLPDMSGKVILVTGGTAGLGYSSVVQLARHNPAHIFFSGRNEASAQNLIAEVKSEHPDLSVTFLQSDLGSLDTVVAAAERFLSLADRLDILMCSAGIMAAPAALTTDGYELQFGTNHLGHALLIKKLLPILSRTAKLPDADVRILILTSLGFRGADGIYFERLKTDMEGVLGYSWIRYSNSKLANVLYARQLAERYPEITTVSIHPGVVGTGLVNNLSFWKKMLVYATNGYPLLSPEEGVYSQLWTASAPRKQIVNGGFYEPVGVLGEESHTKLSKDDGLAKELWDWTEAELERFV